MSYKAVAHLDHADMLEVAIYRKDHPFDKEPISTITVECTKCGEVVEEVYSADDDNTPPLDGEFPEPDRRTWEEGVQDAARIVQNEMRHKKALHHPPQMSVHPAVFETLNEVELHLAAMLSRGSYESCDTVMQDALERPASPAAEAVGEVVVQDLKVRQVLAQVLADAQERCPACKGTGVDPLQYDALTRVCARCNGVGKRRAVVMERVDCNCLPGDMPCIKCGAQDLPSREELVNILESNSMKDPWKQNETQFARLLCEIIANLDGNQTKVLIRDLGTSMDLSPDCVNELFDRAEQVWEKAKAEVK